MVPILFGCLLFAACSGQDQRLTQPAARAIPASDERAESSASTPGTRTIGEAAAIAAVRQVGVPYRYGGNSASGFDCSGLVQFAYAAAGTSVPRTTAEQWRYMEPVNKESLRTGDVLFFNIEGKVSHVGLYLGSHRFVHAPATGREVTIADLHSDFYRTAFIRGGRPR